MKKFSIEGQELVICDLDADGNGWRNAIALTQVPLHRRDKEFDAALPDDVRAALDAQ